MRECCTCKELKAVSAFNKNQWRCRACSKLWYHLNKETHLPKALQSKRDRVLKHREMLRAYLLSHSCVDCGESRLPCLDFDHISGDKFMTVGKMVMGGYSWKKIQEEINKCVVRCANCHRVKTADDFAWWNNQ